MLREQSVPSEGEDFKAQEVDLGSSGQETEAQTPDEQADALISEYEELAHAPLDGTKPKEIVFMDADHPHTKEVFQKFYDNLGLTEQRKEAKSEDLFNDGDEIGGTVVSLKGPNGIKIEEINKHLTNEDTNRSQHYRVLRFSRPFRSE